MKIPGKKKKLTLRNPSLKKADKQETQSSKPFVLVG